MESTLPASKCYRWRGSFPGAEEVGELRAALARSQHGGDYDHGHVYSVQRPAVRSSMACDARSVSDAAGQFHDAGHRRIEDGDHSLTGALQAGQSGGSAGGGYQPGRRGAR
eukprot:8599237-Pyramimonas_sp.AAC.1